MRSRLSPAVRFGYLSALLPLLTIHLSFAFSLAQGHIPACIPYWIDCVSVSSTGRNGIAYFLFKGGMIPTAVMLFLTWQITSSWLVELGQRRSIWLLYLPAIASASLLIYSLALGHSGGEFYLMRRFGVVLFLLCSFLSQVIVGNALQKVQGLEAHGKMLLRFSATILSIAMFSLLLDLLLGDTYGRLENAFEWWLILLLIVHLSLIVRAWQASGLCCTLNVERHD